MGIGAYIVIILVILIGVGLIIFLKLKKKPKVEHVTNIDAEEKSEESNFFPPTPKWKPNLPIDIDLIVEKAKYYTGSKYQFGVFENGTVAFFTEKIDKIEEKAKETLNAIYYSHPDFDPLGTDDGNYLVQYSQPAFTLVFKDEIDKHWEYIENNHLDGVCKDEVLISPTGEKNVFNEIGKICLFARAKMFMDAQNPKVIRTFEPEK